MKRVAKSLALAVGLAACVPAEPDKRPPMGGIALTFAPSAATAGEPFQTFDGWTVTIEKTALRANVYTTPTATEDPDEYGLGSFPHQPHIVDPRFLCELRASQLSPGPWRVAVQLQAADPRWEIDEEDNTCAIDKGTMARFSTFADSDPPPQGASPYEFHYAPSVYVRGFARKGARIMAFDFSLAVITMGADLGRYDDDGEWHPSDLPNDNLVTIEANKGAPARFEVHFELLFSRGMDVIAATDTNGDSVASVEELRAARIECDSTYVDPDSKLGSGSNSGSGDGPGSGSDDDYDPYDPYDRSEPECRTVMDQLKALGRTIVSPTPMKL